jgi:malate dehydrogenase (oxaloacetate-decarboxylating)(NADP+)
MSDLKTAALEYHAKPRPGKLSVELTKPTATARDLALAYSPGVAEPVREIARDPSWPTATPARAIWLP